MQPRKRPAAKKVRRSKRAPNNVFVCFFHCQVVLPKPKMKLRKGTKRSGKVWFFSSALHLLLCVALQAAGASLPRCIHVKNFVLKQYEKVPKINCFFASSCSSMFLSNDSKVGRLGQRMSRVRCPCLLLAAFFNPRSAT